MFSFFIFLFRSNGKSEHLDGNNFEVLNEVMGTKCCSESYLISAMLKVLSQQIRDTLTTAFEIYFTVEDLTGID